MPVQKYDKLIRDGDTKRFRAQKLKFKTRQATREELPKYLRKKLAEELEEFQKAKTTSDKTREAGDLLEALYTIFEVEGISVPGSEKARANTRQIRGGFKNGTILIEMEIPESVVNSK